MNAASYRQSITQSERVAARALVAKVGAFGHGIITDQRSNDYFNPASNYLVDSQAIDEDWTQRHLDEAGDESHYDVSPHDMSRLDDDGNPHVEVYS